MLNKNRKLNEKGLPLEDHPETYLSQRKAVSHKIKAYKDKFNEIVKLLKAMSWKEIRFETTQSDYWYETIILPEPIQRAIKEAYDTDFEKAIADFKQGSHGFKGTIPRLTSFIQMKVETRSQRSHFPNSGIPDSLKGTGLGYKLYRALLQKHKWLQSNTGGTTVKDYAWASLVSLKKDANGNLTEDDVHAIAGHNFVFAMVKNIPDQEKIDIATRFINAIDNKENLTKRNFAVDAELWALLPQNVKDLVDTEGSRAATLERRKRERFAQYAPFGLDAHNWRIGDYIALKSYVLDVNYANLPVRKVVSHEDGEWFAIRIQDIEQYERDGTLNGDNGRKTRNKAEWIKSQPLPGQVDPSAGRLVIKGGPGAEQRQAAVKTPNPNAPTLSRQQLTAIQNVLRRTYMVFVMADNWNDRGTGGAANRNQPIQAYLVEKDGTGRSLRYNVINARTAEMANNLTKAEFDELGLKKLSTQQLQHKSGVAAGDWVFVKEHKTLMGLVMCVAYITQASNTRPGVYVKMPRGQRDIHIVRVNTLYKVTEAATNEWVSGFDTFDMV